MRVASLCVVGASDDAHGRVLVARHSYPKTLCVICPSARLTNHAVTPLLEGDVFIAAFVVHTVNEAASEKRVSVRQEPRDALGLVKAVCFWGSSDDCI